MTPLDWECGLACGPGLVQCQAEAAAAEVRGDDDDDDNDDVDNDDDDDNDDDNDDDDNDDDDDGQEGVLVRGRPRHRQTRHHRRPLHHGQTQEGVCLDILIYIYHYF